MRIGRFIIVVLVAALAAVGAAGAAEQPFEITIQVYRQQGPLLDGSYIEPPGKIIRVRYGEFSGWFRIVLKNVTSQTQELQLESADRGYGRIELYATDENNNENIITKKVDPSLSRGTGQAFVGPGRTKYFDINLTPSEWNNVFKLAQKGATRITVRAAYRNRSTTMFSDPYTVVVTE